jgi:hypothetical protein
MQQVLLPAAHTGYQEQRKRNRRVGSAGADVEFHVRLSAENLVIDAPSLADGQAADAVLRRSG